MNHRSSILNPVLEKWIYFLVLSGFMIPIIFHDIREKRIPDVYTFSGCACLLLVRFLFFTKDYNTLINNLVVIVHGIAAFGIIWLLWFLTSGKIGRGDAKLSAMTAFGLGLFGWGLAVFWASFTGLITGVVLLKTKKLKKKQGIPFAPFLAAGSMISFFTKDLIYEVILCIFKKSV